MKIIVDALGSFSLAAQQNAYPLIKSLRLEYLKPEDHAEFETQKPLQKIKVVLQPISGWIECEEWLVDSITQGQMVSLPIRELKFPFDTLFGLTEEVTLNLQFDAFASDGSRLASSSAAIAILPANYWGGESRQPDLLAAFVKPNGVYVESLLKQVADLLEQAGHERKIDGYQSNTREKPYMMLAALWNVVFNQQLAYVSPPQGFAKHGQRIRLAADISNAKISACLDTSLLFASCIEAMGLNAVVALTNGHAFAGAWLINDRLPVLTNDDPMDVRKRIDNRDMVLIETTLVTNSEPVTFEQAKTYARNLISEENEKDFVFVIDIAQARARQIKPLSTIEVKREEVLAKSATILPMPIIPPLPPVRAEERIQEDTPETRIGTWSRKLLDLTKRNSLLNFSDRAVSIKLFCPDIAAMEDVLAGGEKFRFLSAEESPINDSARDAENFRLQTGSDLHSQYALDQLQNNILIANQNKNRLERNAIELFRKAKNDLEEGGSNTLFLALGMLKWKENPEDDRSYRAPLIMIPVVLDRKSAKSPIVLHQLQDEEPIFNLTLLEFMHAEHDIDLSEFKDGLPTDESGVDVPYVWQRVREAISEHRGFEVIEDLVLASFSFAKYLMWKDLRDRIDDLKENPFVKHLVDNPRETYPQDSHFIERNQVDDKIDPAGVFSPLNCDSSQLVAVEASGRPQDFVLEGPPGTGKSETIANIIAHNIGKGRKVLFVAEKMAALNVVYRRMQKVGLSHLCLELHSNKANKRAVLDQLNKAWQKREGLSSNDWALEVADLKQKRDLLNSYIRALHKKASSGVSLRDALSKLALKGSSLKFSLGWANDLNAAPVTTELDLQSVFKLIEALSLAFNDIKAMDVRSLNAVQAVSWSNAWQTKLIESLEKISSSIFDLELSAVHALKQFELNAPSSTPSDLERMSRLSELISLALHHSIGFALTSGAKDRLLVIQNLASKKRNLDQLLSVIGKNVTPESLSKIPVENWLRWEEESQNGWFKAIINKWKVNADAKKLGFLKFDELADVKNIKQACDLKYEIEQHVISLAGFDIWRGWKTEASELDKLHSLGIRVRSALSGAMSLSEDPSRLMLPIKKWLIDGRDFLEGSKLISAWNEFDLKYEQFIKIKRELEVAGFSIADDQGFRECVQAISKIIGSSVKLKAWCEWQAEKKKAEERQLSSLVVALEGGLVDPSDLQEQFYIAYCQWLAPLVIDAEPLLREFKSSSHELTIERFREQDAKVAKITSDYVIALATAKMPQPNASSTPQEFGTLARELQKKSRHIPTRALIKQLGEALLDLCPCLMMSPLSVAQFLPSDFRGFDLVVFDEASQMTTWDSVGAIARGKNVIVVGDPKQMPPTNFFSAAASNDDPEEEDLESILDQALAARLPLRRLMGHYRSRHETLIAFSNSKYYENSLVTYPSSDTKESAVTLHRINGVYAKGKGRNNPVEAKAVVDEIVRRLSKQEGRIKTIGVVTLNTDQQRTIEDLLDDARRAHPNIEPYFHGSENYDAVFVKNLESVQGDERDIIMLSLGYGPTEVGGKTMSMNFGPLNKAGGERRLNVAITRATSEVLVFASFDSSMIDLSRTSATAVEHLKHYLEFAERGPSALAEQATAAYGVDQFDSDFEQAVAFALRQKGWKVQTQVGVSKFKIDLGVLHPEKPGFYLAGIECDGATYHGSPSARDRDRVRQAILENLGWRIIRLWSTDYFIDADAAIEKINVKLQELLDRDRTEIFDNRVDLEVQDLAIEISNASESVLVEETETFELLRTQGDLDASDYFKESYKASLTGLVREILKDKSGITLHSLALEVANLHGLNRTSKKQIDYLKSVIEAWAGVVEIDGYSPTVWLKPADIVDEIPWRGVDAFGYSRLWSELPYQETLGLARYALEKSPNNPIGFICDEFDLKRRHEKTLTVFSEWVARVKS
jgi:very-short-patch-repair endonuclease